MAEKRDQADAFHLQVGDILQLQVPGEELRLTVRVIGYHPGNSLIVTAPRAQDKLLLVREGQVYIVRMLVGRWVYGFNVTVLRSCTYPYPYLHLSYPSEVQSLQVRTSSRIRTKLIVAVRPAEGGPEAQEPVVATLSDISLAGAQVTSRTPLGEVGGELTIAVRVSIGTAEHAISLPATICNKALRSADKDGEGNVYGVSFHDIADGESLVLHAYVYQQWVAELIA